MRRILMAIFLIALNSLPVRGEGIETIEVKPKQVAWSSETLNTVSAEGREPYERVFQIVYTLADRPYYYQGRTYENSVRKDAIWDEKGNEVLSYQWNLNSEIPIPRISNTFPRFLSFWQDGEMRLKNLETGEFVTFPKKVIQVKVEQGFLPKERREKEPISIIYKTEDNLVGVLDSDKKLVDEILGINNDLFLSTRARKDSKDNVQRVFTYRKNEETYSNLHINDQLIIEQATGIEPIEFQDNLWLVSKDGKWYLKDLNTGWESERFPYLIGGNNPFFRASSHIRLGGWSDPEAPEELKILHYENNQLIDITPRDFKIRYVADFSQEENGYFFFWVEGKNTMDIYKYEDQEWKLVYETNFGILNDSRIRIYGKWLKEAKLYQFLQGSGIGTTEWMGYYNPIEKIYFDRRNLTASINGEYIAYDLVGSDKMTIWKRNGEEILDRNDTGDVFKINGLNAKKLLYHEWDKQEAYIFDLEEGKEYRISEKMRRKAFYSDFRRGKESFFIYQQENGEWVLFEGNTMQFYTFPKLDAERVSILHGSRKNRTLVLEIREKNQVKLMKWTWDE